MSRKKKMWHVELNNMRVWHQLSPNDVFLESAQTARAVNRCAQVCAVILGDVRPVTVDRRTVTAAQTLDAHLKNYSRRWIPKPLHSMLWSGHTRHGLKTLARKELHFRDSAGDGDFWTFLWLQDHFSKARMDSRVLQPFVLLVTDRALFNHEGQSQVADCICHVLSTMVQRKWERFMRITTRTVEQENIFMLLYFSRRLHDQKEEYGVCFKRKYHFNY